MCNINENILDTLLLHLDRYDNTGIRFYLGNQLRRYDLGYLSLSLLPSPLAIAIPPRVDQFTIDSYCPAEVTEVIKNSILYIAINKMYYRVFLHLELQLLVLFHMPIYKVNLN